MKKIILILSVITLIFVSCDNNESDNSNLELNNLHNSNQLNKIDPIKYHLVYANWESWGRTSKDCGGFGLCHFQSCSFCCTQDDVIIDCPKNQRLFNSGTIVIDKTTNMGFLIIELDPLDNIQLNAINNNEILYVDENLTNENIKLHKGNYQFDEEIGLNGGYKVIASMN